jgi:hypothetical protein
MNKNLKSTAAASLGKSGSTVLATPAAQRAAESFARVIGRETTRDNQLELHRRRAFGETMNALIESFPDEDALANFFVAVESVATAGNRTKIATHPLRPAIVDELLAAEEIAAEEVAAVEKAAATDEAA